MAKWLSKVLGKKAPEPRRPSEVPVDERALELVKLGDKMLAVEDYNGAMDAYESALRLDGRCATAWQRRGGVLMHYGDIPGALACCVRALELDDSLPLAWLGIGEGILGFIREDKEPLFIRENRPEILSEACDCFARALKLDAQLEAARRGLETGRAMLKDISFRLASPRIFSFHSGSVLEKAKREVVSPFLKPGDYRRKSSAFSPHD